MYVIGKFSFEAINAEKGIPAVSPPEIFVILLKKDSFLIFFVAKLISFALSFGNEIILLQSQYTGLNFPDVNLNGLLGLKFIEPILILSLIHI